MYFSTPQWDLNLLFLINQQGHSGILNPVMLLVSDSLFLFAFGLVASIIAMWRYKVSLTVVLGLGLTLIASSQVCDFAKKETNRVRPYHSIGGTWFHDDGTWKQRPENATPRSGGSSYPSGHSANAAAAALFLYLAFRKKIVWLLPLLIGYSRIYLGKHFPSDVVAGWALGIAVASILVPLYPALWRRFFSLWMRYRLRV